MGGCEGAFWRNFKEVRAVDDISFEIEAGERVGFLGPNGAGKTTTLKMLSGLLYPTAGSAHVAGFTPFERKQAFLERITLVMGQKQQLLWDLPPTETFELNRAVYGIDRAEFKETVKELTELLGIGDLLGKPARQLSLGERMKCELAATLLHRPDILFLDEPTIGLDVSMQATIRSFIQSYNQRFNATIILTSHYMDDVVALCPRIIVIDHGRLRFDGPLPELIEAVRPEKRLSLRLHKPVELADLAALGEVVSNEATRAVVQVKKEQLQEVLQKAVATLPIADLSLEDPPLEDVMRDLFANGTDLMKRDSAS